MITSGSNDMPSNRSPNRSPKEQLCKEQQTTGNIATYVRLLPAQKQSDRLVEYTHSASSTISFTIPDDADPSFFVNSDSNRVTYEFDQVFDADATQNTIFEVVAKSKVLSVFDGINSTVFAFGQTGSGKTYTIFGGDSFQDRGLIPRSIACLFKQYRIKKGHGGCSFIRCRVSFTEVYKETVYDLLDQNKKTMSIDQWPVVQVFEAENGLTLRNLNVFDVETEDEALSFFFLGSANRHSTTRTTEKSSRSHAIFTIILDTKGIRENGKTVSTSGKINFVDLAGSDRLSKTNPSKIAIEETKSINLALHYLENVIVSLREQQLKRVEHGNTNAHRHVPYRNSMLTSILRDSLGGNCQTAFILNVSSERLSFEETISTCRFGQRLADVRTHVHANAEISLADQLTACKSQLRRMEQHCHHLENENALLSAELSSERQAFHEQWQSRSLNAQEKTDCKQRVQTLFTIAKKAAVLMTTGSANTVNDKHKNAMIDDNEGPERSETDEKAATAGIDEDTKEATAMINASQEELYAALEQMDRAVLIELSTALGGLVQTMYLEREKTKIQVHIRKQQKQQLYDEKIAEEKAKENAEEEERQKRIEGLKIAALQDEESKINHNANDDMKANGVSNGSVNTSLLHHFEPDPASIAGGGPSPIPYNTSSNTTPSPHLLSPPPSSSWSQLPAPSTGMTNNTQAMINDASNRDRGVLKSQQPSVSSSRPISLNNSSSVTPRSPRILLSEETYQMLLHGENFYVRNIMGLRSQRFYAIDAELKHLTWRSASATAVFPSSQPLQLIALTTFNGVQYDDKQSINGLYLITMIPQATNEKPLVLEYQSTSSSKANRWYMALSFCVDKALDRL